MGYKRTNYNKNFRDYWAAIKRNKYDFRRDYCHGRLKNTNT